MIRAVCRRAGTTGVLALGFGVLLTAGVVHLTTASLHAQQQFELFVAAISSATHQPATDLTPDDVVMTEKGQRGRVVRMERYSLPVKLTVLVDNGAGTAAALANYRSALRALIEALPPGLETEIIAMAPNPRWLVRGTADRVQLLRAADLVIPDETPSRFTDALVEYARRLDRDFQGEVEQARSRQAYMPVLVALSTTGLDGSEARRDDVLSLESFVKHGVRTHFAMVSQRSGGGLSPDVEGGPQVSGLEIAEGSQIFVARALHDLTKGQYEALAIPSRAVTLLGEWGKQIAMTHLAGSNQYRITLERPLAAAGQQLTDLSMAISREGYYGVVTADGRVP